MTSFSAKKAPFPFKMRSLTVVLTAAVLAACGGSDSDDASLPVTPATVSLEKIGSYSAGVFGQSAAEIVAFHKTSKRAFVVNAEAGALDVLDLSHPSQPRKIQTLSTKDVVAVDMAGAQINSVAVHGDVVALAIEANPKTDPGRVALLNANSLAKLADVQVGAQPDSIVFTPDGKHVLTPNEGEPNNDYSVDPEGSISIIDVADPTKPVVRMAAFTAFNGQERALRAQGVRIFGPASNQQTYGAGNLSSAAKDFEPEYIAVSSDSKTAWATLQENNALAKIDIASATVTAILPLGYKDYGQVGNEIDASDNPAGIHIKTWPGVVGMYHPDTIASFAAGSTTYLVTANEGDSRAWGEDDDAYWAGDRSKGFVEEFRVKHLVHKGGFDRRANDDLPPQLRDLAAGALLNPSIFNYCGATAGEPGDCRSDAVLGRLNISWTEGFQKNADGTPRLYNAAGVVDANGDRLMYDTLHSYGARSISIWDENGAQVWDSGAQLEQFIANQITTRTGKSCTITDGAATVNCASYFNSGHDEGDAFDSRSDAKGPEPEGLTVGTIGEKTFAFIGLERFGGVVVYDITDPKQPTLEDYLNTRTEWASDPETNLAAVGDLGPEGLAFVSAADSPNGKPLLLVGNEVSGTTTVFQLNLAY
ncbi:choice-of-anchor I family protein [Lampropedia aestuarii]|uniref:choice-of-anchor I family protein n=1 Tax=Lampropedia aestuarii TaxID=2562762 RepID=UPI0024693800|nr:choice-of-anchor I family protein [Lampropedia aestuarii]MDH5855984.1 choice-of-anchor I family protein [Lampropedia aestuarii]